MPLTPRQTQILLLICQGKASKEIGDLLKIGTNVVDAHVIKIKKRLKANSRAHAVAIYFKLINYDT